jgi:hypothetical protein
MSIKAHVWCADHTGGTKFYQVLRFVNTDSGQSFAIAHFGAMGVFTGVGKVSTGQMQVADVAGSGTTAGQSKIREKKKGGYTQNERQAEETFATKEDLLAWCRTNIGSKHLSTVRGEINKMNWSVTAKAADPDPWPIPKREPDEPNHVKHADWGSW